MDTKSLNIQEKLDINDILIAEFQYIAQTAFQANEDRARVSNFYFVTAAAAVAAIVGAKVEATSTVITPAGIYIGFCVLFAVLSVVGLITLLQLARLRMAWTESAKAMNLIKQYYIDHFKDQQPEKAFAWTLKSIPPVSKRKSVAFLLAISIIIVDAVTISTSTIYLSLAFGASTMDREWLIIGLLAGFAFALIQYYWYLSWLK